MTMEKKEKKKFWILVFVGAIVCLPMHLLFPIFIVLWILSAIAVAAGIVMIVINFFINEPLLNFAYPFRLRNVFALSIGYLIMAIITL